MEVAELTHISGRKIAKTVMVKMDGKMTMIVLPASYSLNFNRLGEAADVEHVELATENDFEDEEIAFNAGNHRELIRMSFEDFDELARPKRLNFSCKLVKS